MIRSTIVVGSDSCQRLLLREAKVRYRGAQLCVFAQIGTHVFGNLLHPGRTLH